MERHIRAGASASSISRSDGSASLILGPMSVDHARQTPMKKRRMQTISGVWIGPACQVEGSRVADPFGSTHTTVGTTEIPYLRARSGRSFTSTPTNLVPR